MGNGRGAVWIVSIDTAAVDVCGDGDLTVPETCDDGNLSAGDGWYSTCRIEDEVGILGTAQGGTVQVILNGVGVLISTSAGQSASTVSANLASAINITPSLQAIEVSSVGIGPRVVSDETFDTAGSMDPGLFIVVPEPGIGLMLMAGVIGLNLLYGRRAR